MQKQIGTDMDDIVSEEINNQSEYVEVDSIPFRKK